MQGTLLVTPQQLKTTSTSFSQRGKSITSITSSMMSLVKGLKSSFEGDAGNAYINKFSQLQEDMTQINNKIQEHVSDLNEMADNYARTEASNTQANSQPGLNTNYI